MQHMQHPTCTDMRIRSTGDAHKIFYAIQRGLLQMVTRRLDADERSALRSGCIYAWEERGPHSEITGLGIERFTEGRRWSPSRVRDEFLFYYEKYTPPPEATHPGAPTERHPPRDWDPLVKQTYSVWVDTEKGRRKWHLTAYFTQATIDQLGTIDDISGVRDLVVPDGQFKSTRVGKSRGKSDAEQTRSGETSKSSSTVTRTYAPFPSPYPLYQPHPEPPATSQPVLMYEPYQNMQSHSGPAYQEPETEPAQYTAPPPASTQSIPLRPSYYSNSGSYQRPAPSPQSYSDPSHTDTKPIDQIPKQPPALHLQQPYPTPSSYPPQLSSAHEPHTGRAGSMYSSSPSSWSNSSSQDGLDRHYPAAPYDVASSYSMDHSHQPPSAQSHPRSYPYSVIAQPQPQHQVQAHHLQSHSQYPSISPEPAGGHMQADPSCRPARPERYSLPPLDVPAEIYPATYSYELSDGNPHSARTSSRRGSTGVGPCRDLAPLNTLTRPHPYRRDPKDDIILRMLNPNSPP